MEETALFGMGMTLGSGLVGRVETNRLGTLRKYKTSVTTLTSDGGELLNPEPAPAGQKLKLALDDFASETFDVVSVACQAEGLDAYRIRVKLTTGTWPYALYSRIATVAHSYESARTAPKCLKELGLTAGATVDEVENAFARLVRRCHPDRGGSVDEFVRVRRAYLDSLAYLGSRR